MLNCIGCTASISSPNCVVLTNQVIIKTCCVLMKPQLNRKVGPRLQGYHTTTTNQYVTQAPQEQTCGRHVIKIFKQ